MPGAKYVVDKYSGEIISVTMQENNTNDAVVQQEDNTIQQTTPHIYTREEVNAMFTMDFNFLHIANLFHSFVLLSNMNYLYYRFLL